jgi:hypothetical protein
VNGRPYSMSRKSGKPLQGGPSATACVGASASGNFPSKMSETIARQLAYTSDSFGRIYVPAIHPIPLGRSSIFTHVRSSP